MYAIEFVSSIVDDLAPLRAATPLLVNVEGLDAEQIELDSSNKFWKLMAERRAQFTISREPLDEPLRDE